MAQKTMLTDDLQSSLAEATDSILGGRQHPGMSRGSGLLLDAHMGPGDLSASMPSSLGIGQARTPKPFPTTERGYGMPAAGALQDEYLFGAKGATQHLGEVSSQTPVGGAPVPGYSAPEKPLLTPVGNAFDATKDYLKQSGSEIADSYGRGRIKGVLGEGVGALKDRVSGVATGAAGLWSKEAEAATRNYFAGDGGNADTTQPATTGLGLGMDAVLAGAKEGKAIADARNPEDAKYYEGENRTRALKFAADEGFTGTDEEKIQQAIDAKRETYAAREARRSGGFGTRDNGTPITGGMDAYIAANNLMKQQVFEAAKEGKGIDAQTNYTLAQSKLPALLQKHGPDVVNVLNNPDRMRDEDPAVYNDVMKELGAALPGGGGGLAKANGFTKIAQLASADPTSFRASGDKFAQATANELNIAAQQAGSFGNLPKAMQKDFNDFANKLRGLKGVSGGGKTQALLKEKNRLLKSLASHAAASKQTLDTKGAMQKQQIARATAVSNIKYKDASLAYLKANRSKGATKTGTMGEKDLNTAMSDMVDNGDIDEVNFFKKLDSAINLKNAKQISDIRDQQLKWTRKELKFLGLHERAQSYTK